jgi:hypothetical protein
MTNEDQEKAVQIINEENLQFPSLFLLQSEIIKANLSNRLSIRNQVALAISNKIIGRSISDATQLSLNDFKGNYTILKWILETGYRDDGLSNQYDETLEVAAIVLSKFYRDDFCLQIIEEMIFNRHNRGSFNYDLIWAFFEYAEPEILVLIANRLRSPNSKDIELARKLLNFIPCINANLDDSPNRLYQCAKKWIYQNYNYLYYTGESFLQTSTPNRFSVSLESKYLQSKTIKEHGMTARALSEDENALLESFKTLDFKTKLQLSACSSLLYRNNKYRWNKWLQAPIQEQIRFAKKVAGKTNDFNKWQ